MEQTVKDYEVGETAYVHTYGYWYEGKVVKIGRTRVHVEYTTGTGTTRVKACKMTEISKEKHEGERKANGRRKSAERRKRDAEFNKALEEGRVRISMQIEWKHHLDPVRCLAAFQALSWHSGFFKGVTHTQARNIIEECTGLKLKKGRQPPRGKGWGLEGYLKWASEPGNHHPLDMDNLPPGMHLLTIVPEQEAAAS